MGSTDAPKPSTICATRSSGERLLTITQAVAAHTRSGLSLVRLMNSRIDAQKLVSSLHPVPGNPRELADSAEGEKSPCLCRGRRVRARQRRAAGIPPCRYTLDALAQ